MITMPKYKAGAKDMKKSKKSGLKKKSNKFVSDLVGVLSDVTSGKHYILQTDTG